MKTKDKKNTSMLRKKKQNWFAAGPLDIPCDNVRGVSPSQTLQVRIHMVQNRESVDENVSVTIFIMI